MKKFRGSFPGVEIWDTVNWVAEFNDTNELTYLRGRYNGHIFFTYKNGCVGDDELNYPIEVELYRRCADDAFERLAEVSEAVNEVNMEVR